MSLKVWLPLDGDLHNQGVLNPSISATTPSYTVGKIGQCYKGTDLTITTNNNFGKIWSLCFWGYVIGNSITSNWTLIARLNDNNSNLRIEVCPSSYSNGIYCYSTHNNASYAITNGTIASPSGGYYDKWAHFCLTSDGTTITKYMNGIKIGTSNYTGSGYINGTFFFANNDKIYKNDIRIYDHCLSAAEVHEIAMGLVLHYKLDDITNGIIDSSGYGRNGIAASDLIYSTDTPRYNSAYTFNGNVSHRIHYDENTFNYTDNFSYALWCRANYTGTAAQYLFTVGRADAGGYGYGIQNSSPTNLVMRFGNQTWNTQIETNTWTHIAFVKSGTTIKIYKNGVLYSTNTFSGTLPTYSDGKGLGLGCFHYSGDIYPGYGAISDFRIYCTPLLDTDIKLLYNVGMRVDNLGGVHTFEFDEKNNNLLAGTLITSTYGNRINPYRKYNSNGEMYFDTNGTSAGSDYISINPTNHTYYYDFDISVNTGNQFYIGFERYDANKTSRSNNACTYIYASNSPTDINHKHIFGTVNLSTDGVNPCAFIALRILNGWSGTTSGVVGTATIHSMNLREISTIQNPKLYKNGILLTGEFKEYQKANFYKNGFIESTEFIEI